MECLQHVYRFDCFLESLHDRYTSHWKITLAYKLLIPGDTDRGRQKMERFPLSIILQRLLINAVVFSIFMSEWVDQYRFWMKAVGVINSFFLQELFFFLNILKLYQPIFKFDQNLPYFQILSVNRQYYIKV